MFIRSGYLLFVLVAFAFNDARTYAAEAVVPAQLLSDDNQPQHAVPSAAPAHPAEEGSKVEVMWELDPYYSDEIGRAHV